MCLPGTHPSRPYGNSPESPGTVEREIPLRHPGGGTSRRSVRVGNGSGAHLSKGFPPHDAFGKRSLPSSLKHVPHVFWVCFLRLRHDLPRQGEGQPHDRPQRFQRKAPRSRCAHARQPTKRPASTWPPTAGTSASPSPPGRLADGSEHLILKENDLTENTFKKRFFNDCGLPANRPALAALTEWIDLTASWLACHTAAMKTTIDLPEDLVTDVKIRAAKDRRTMKEVTAEALRNWLDVRKEGIASVTASEPTLSPEKKKRLEAFRDYRSHLQKNLPSEERRASLTDYLKEYREDRQTFGGREQAP